MLNENLLINKNSRQQDTIRDFWTEEKYNEKYLWEE